MYLYLYLNTLSEILKYSHKCFEYINACAKCSCAMKFGAQVELFMVTRN